ncbi:MAG: M20 family metallo-hydrolase [Verrucomicrobiota bacterium]
MNGHSPSPADRAVARLDELGQVSDHADLLTRSFLSPANLLAANLISSWMEKLGMNIDHAVDGTIRGILPGSDRDATPLLLGSHIDTVFNAGRFDGSLGIIVALAALETLREQGITLTFPIHLLGFSDEEGTRFHTTYLGSRGIVGPLDEETLERKDDAGDTLSSVLKREGWHDDAVEIRYAPGEVLGYVEAHIEQGRVLENEQLAACGVSAIVGQLRLRVTVTGGADHAGTTPMNQRRDALAGAAECILAAERQGRECEGAVVTVGKLVLQPNVPNTIPQSTHFTIDLRHAIDEERTQLQETLHAEFSDIVRKRSLELTWTVVQETNAVPCDSALTEKMLEAVSAVTGRRFCMASGAGHDGVIVSRIAPITMLFVRCRDGLSHHPDEYASPGDIADSVDILVQFLNSLGA